MTPHTPVEGLVAKWREDARCGSGYATTAYEDGRIAEKLKCARDLEEALASLPVEGWRSMDSAPKDGTYVLIANFGQESDEARWHDGSQNHWGKEGWYFVDSDLLTSHPCQPDLWMPKPFAPQDQRQGNEQGGTHE